MVDDADFYLQLLNSKILSLSNDNNLTSVEFNQALYIHLQAIMEKSFQAFNMVKYNEKSLFDWCLFVGMLENTLESDRFNLYQAQFIPNSSSNNKNLITFFCKGFSYYHNHIEYLVDDYTFHLNKIELRILLELGDLRNWDKFQSQNAELIKSNWIYDYLTTNSPKKDIPFLWT